MILFHVANLCPENANTARAATAAHGQQCEISSISQPRNLETRNTCVATVTQSTTEWSGSELQLLLACVRSDYLIVDF